MTLDRGLDRPAVYAAVYWSMVGALQSLAFHPAFLMTPASGVIQVAVLVLMTYGLIRDRRAMAFALTVALAASAFNWQTRSARFDPSFWLGFLSVCVLAAGVTLMVRAVPDAAARKRERGRTVVSELERLAALHARGVIDNEELAIAKRKLL